MNERIREFAALAKEHADTYDDSGTPIWFYMYNEKLAELIVRECMTVSRKATGLDAEYEAWYLIQEHFGVDQNG